MSSRLAGSFVVFAKEPAPGRVKTRLSPALTPEQAAELYGCMLDDVLETTVAAAERAGFEVVLAIDPPEAREALARRAPAGVRVVAQCGGDLGARMERAAAEVASGGPGPVLLRGSDSPGLTMEMLLDAASALAEADLVAAPDPDGGYSLVGLARPVPGLFDHAMSHENVLDQTFTAARRRGLEARTLEPGFDLDTVDDLVRLVEQARGGGAGSCPRTLAWLARHPISPHSTRS